MSGMRLLLAMVVVFSALYSTSELSTALRCLSTVLVLALGAVFSITSWWKGAHSQDQTGGKASAPSSNDCHRVFCSHQHTQRSVEELDKWVKGEAVSVKASVPPFNTRLGVEFPCEKFNVAVFGVKLQRAIMKLFESEEIQQLSREVKIPIPKYGLSNFVQKKMPKVLDLVREARKPENHLDAANLAAVTKLESFCIEFSKLEAKDISGPADFQAFVEQHVAEGWEDHLHFDSILVSNFGFTQAVSDQLRTLKITQTDKNGESEELTLEHHSLRWLGKAFTGYGPVGCLTDVANLIHALLNLPKPSSSSQEATLYAIAQLQECLEQKKFDSLWIPTHLAHDAETDDALCWLFLVHLHRILGTTLQVLIQLPEDEKMDAYASFLQKHSEHVQVFRDKDSTNAKPVTDAWMHLVGNMTAKDEGTQSR